MAFEENNDEYLKSNMPPALLDILNKSISEESKRQSPYLMRALCTAAPNQLHSEIPGDVYNISWEWDPARKKGEGGKGGKYRKIARGTPTKEGLVILEIPNAVFDHLQEGDKKGEWTHPQMRLEIFLGQCKISFSRFVVAEILETAEGGNVEGRALMLEQEDYTKLMRQTLTALADPERGMKLCGSSSPKVFWQSLEDEKSEPGKMIRNLCKHAGLERKEMDVLIALAGERNNFEYAKILRDHMETIDKKLGKGKKGLDVPHP